MDSRCIDRNKRQKEKTSQQGTVRVLMKVHSKNIFEIFYNYKSLNLSRRYPEGYEGESIIVIYQFEIYKCLNHIHTRHPISPSIIRLLAWIEHPRSTHSLTRLSSRSQAPQLI